MYILAIETTGAFASVALAEAEWKDGKVTEFTLRGHVEGHDRFSHLQNLAPQIEQVLGESGLLIGDVSVIAVSRGPGSFTGIRIGVSTARALSQVLGTPCASVPSLEAMALRQKAGKNDGIDPVVCPIIDARRSQVYGGGFYVDEENGTLDEVIPSGPYTVDEFLDAIAKAGVESVLFMGDGVDKYRDLIEEQKESHGLDSCAFAYAAEECRYQKADTVAFLGAKLAASGKLCQFEELKPDYMRQAEAERKLKEKQTHG